MKFEWHDGAVKRAIPDIDEADLTEADFYDLPIHTRTSKYSDLNDLPIHTRTSKYSD